MLLICSRPPACRWRLRRALLYVGSCGPSFQGVDRWPCAVLTFFTGSWRSIGNCWQALVGGIISHPRDTGTSVALGQCACVLFSEWQKAKTPSARQGNGGLGALGHEEISYRFNGLSPMKGCKFCRRLSSEGLRCSESFGVSRLSPLARERQIEQSVLTAAADYTPCFRFVPIFH